MSPPACEITGFVDVAGDGTHGRCCSHDARYGACKKLLKQKRTVSKSLYKLEESPDEDVAYDRRLLHMGVDAKVLHRNCLRCC